MAMPGARRTGRPWSVAIPLLALVGALLILTPGTGERAARAQWPTWLNETPKPVTFPEILVDAGWLARHQHDPDLLVMDARATRDYLAGHIPGAISVPALIDGQIKISTSVLMGIRSIVCYSDARQPMNAGRLFHDLEALGGQSEGVYVLNGGFDGWRRHGGTSEVTSRPARKGDGTPWPGTMHRLQPSSDTTVVTTIETLAKRYGRPGLTILDPRPVAEWEKGHIPHSLPVNFEEFRNDDGTLMDGPTMRPILATFGPRDRDFINLNDAFVIAGLPPAGATVHPYLALRVMGIPSVKLLPSSFEAWRDQGLPVTRVLHAKEMRAFVEKAHSGRVTDRPVPSMILLDLRHDGDFNYSHLPGALLLSPDRFDAQLDSLVNAHWPHADRTTIPFAVYCYGPDCIRSRIATTKAAQLGFRNLLWFRDGPQGYRSAGGKLFGQIGK